MHSRVANNPSIRKSVISSILIVFVGLLWLTSIGIHASPQQAPPPQNPVRMAEEVFQNVQVLKGIPADEFLDTMGMFSSALLFDCVSCHAQEIISDPKGFSIATPRIQRARQMVVMMNAINKQVLRRAAAGDLLYLPRRRQPAEGRAESRPSVRRAG